MGTAVRERGAARAAAEPVRPSFAPSRIPTWALPAIVGIGVALRVWRVQSNGLTFDESFTANAGRLPVGDLFSYLRHNDSHPPLDYLLRVPFARAGASDFWMRSPSLLFSCAALALFAWWMRDRGRVGLIATALMAVSSFQLVYGGEARMYALLQLLGVALALVAERWLRGPARWHAWAAGALLLVALFDHVSAVLLAAGLLALAGFRTDRDAWRWRAAVVIPGVVWLAAWGPALLDQRQGRWASWIPRTTPTGFAEAVSRQVTLLEGVAWLVLAAVVAGGVILVRRDRVLGRVLLACGALPFCLAAVIGLFTPFLFDRTLSLSSWAPLLALAALLEAVAARASRAPRAGGALALGVVLVIAALSCAFLVEKRWDYDLSVERLEQVAQPGDVIAVRPARYGILVDWRIGVRGATPSRHVSLTHITDADALLMAPGAARTGRVWLLTPVGSTTTFPGYSRCAPRWTDRVTEILCLRRVP